MATAKTKTKAQPNEKAAPAAAGKTSTAKWDSRRLHTVTPHLVCAGAAKAIEFYKQAFGAEEVMRLEGPDGSLWHACVTIGDSAVMLVDEMPQMQSLGPNALKGTPVTIHLNVPDADASIGKAVAAGAKVLMSAADMFWGDRYGVILDPFGHKWSVATHIRDMTVDEIKAAIPKGM
jgi:PhnB protein